MTSTLLAPRRRREGRPVARGQAEGSCAATPILDWESAAVRVLTGNLDTTDPRAFLRAMHRRIAEAISPVYAMEDLQPASVTVRRGRGSCSQRFAVLEAVARRAGIATRVRGLAVDGSFWYPRFPRLTALVPERVILAWPEFRLNGEWVSIGELYGPLDQMVACGTGFSNTAGETLFEAVGRTAVDWTGHTGVASCDLSAVVREDLGYFDSRDDLFRAQGQTLAWLPRRIGDPIMRRRAAAG